MGERQNVDINIRPSEHLFVCGQTQSGKTYFILYLLRRLGRRKVIIIDVKAARAIGELPGAVFTDRPDEVERLLEKHRIVVFRPDIRDNWIAQINEVMMYAYYRRNVLVYNDERGGWPKPWDTEPLAGEMQLVMRGAERHSSLWTGCQRTRRIPIALKSEPDHFVVFRLQNGDDRKDISTYAGDAINTKEPIPKRYFFYRGQGDSVKLYPPLATPVYRQKQ